LSDSETLRLPFGDPLGKRSGQAQHNNPCCWVSLPQPNLRVIN